MAVYGIPSVAGSPVVGNLLQTLQIVQLYTSILAADEAVILKPCKYATHGLFRDSQMVSYIAARHAQVEFGSRTMAPRELLRQTEQERSQTLFSIMLTQQQQQFMAVMDFRTHDLENFMLDGGICTGQLFKAINGNFANRGNSRRLGFAVVLPALYGVQTQQFSYYVKAYDLHLPILGADAGFDRSAADDIHVFHRLPHAIQNFSAFKHVQCRLVSYSS
jgi:hypothetical protein